MDTSETYIKMCEKAEEIQAFKVYDPMSWYYRKDIAGNEVKEGRNLVSVALSIWLPRQDQLQEMVHPLDCTYTISYVMLDNFINWYKKATYRSLEKIYSMEQLWLAFVMKEKYNKIWNGQEWT